ncbi:MAG: preprotein translocase subunit SecE [Candidatus Omnitrophota bacterium]|nr:preprotein translocase subunit SecE [Candidatus Omnitrophota bacterium]
MNIIRKPVKFLKEVKAELGKVSWSGPQELMDSTIVVIITTIIMTLFIWVVDLLCAGALRRIFH